MGRGAGKERCTGPAGKRGIASIWFCGLGYGFAVLELFTRAEGVEEGA
jgi:hypothetical protein